MFTVIGRNSENCLTLSSSMRNLEFVHGPPERIAGDGGSLIGPADFEFSSLLGQGGFGAVFKARRKTTGLEYAMKVQPIESLCRSARSSRNSTEDETIIQMERTVLISCRGHPFITGIEYAFHTDTYAVLGLEYVPGGTLAMCIENSPDGYLPLSLCKTYVMELASAIDFIHKKGVIYRDLKVRLGESTISYNFLPRCINRHLSSLRTLITLAVKCAHNIEGTSKADRLWIGRIHSCIDERMLVKQFSNTVGS